MALIYKLIYLCYALTEILRKLDTVLYHMTHPAPLTPGLQNPKENRQSKQLHMHVAAGIAHF